MSILEFVEELFSNVMAQVFYPFEVQLGFVPSSKQAAVKEYFKRDRMFDSVWINLSLGRVFGRI